MMKRTMITVIFILLSIVCNAQLVYQNAALTFAGPRHNGTYMTTWHGWAHAWVDVENPKRFLTMVLSNADPRIASGSGDIAFYDGVHGYNRIQVGSIYNASDISLKSNVRLLNNVTSTVMQLRPVTYNLHRTNDRSVSASNTHDYGFIAQEVEEILPDIVIEDDEGMKLVNYTAIIPILTATIQELIERVEQLESQLTELSN